jgi:putative N-acetylglucosamine-6-sulfatase
MHFYNDIDSWELYDLKTDPEQMNNIYGKPGTEKLTKELKKQLLQLQVQYDDPIRKKEDIMKR